MLKKKIGIGAVIAVVLIAVIAAVAFMIKAETRADEISAEAAQDFINTEFDKMAEKNPVLSYVAKENHITVESLKYGDEKDVILHCTVKTMDVYGAVSPLYDKFLSSTPRKDNGTMFKSALDFKLEFQPELTSLVASSKEKTVQFDAVIYDTKSGWQIYAEEEAVNAVYGGVIDITEEINAKDTYTDSVGEHEIQSGNVNKGFNQCLSLVRDTAKPDTAGFFGKTWNSLKEDFNRNFIEHDRWKTIFKGLWVTIKLTIFALLIGIILGFLVAFVRCTYLKLPRKGAVLRFLNWFCELYLTITRGTPVVVQIMIIYFVIFMPIGVDKFLAAVICFGLNSGAYVAEIVRGGIMSVDNGQTEAGRSLGFSYMQTMFIVVFPQAFKNVLPALANEFVVLLKETSIAFYIGLGDLMYAGNAIRAATYSAFMPLVAVAIIYLVMVLILSKLVSLLERRLRNSER